MRAYTPARDTIYSALIQHENLRAGKAAVRASPLGRGIENKEEGQSQGTKGWVDMPSDSRISDCNPVTLAIFSLQLQRLATAPVGNSRSSLSLPPLPLSLAQLGRFANPRT